MRKTLVTLSLLLSTGCATLFTGTSDKVTFNANVPGVRLTIDGRVQGELPLTLELSRSFMGGELFMAKFEKPGYQTQEFKLRREFNAVAILDITSTVTSGGVDVLTGALMKYSPTDYHVEMIKKGAGSKESRRELQGVRFALTCYRELQGEIARGGGEHLAAFARLLGGDDEPAARRITERSLKHAPELLDAESALAFLERFDGMLAQDPSLRAYRL